MNLDQYYCPVEKNYSIYGAFYSDEFRYIQGGVQRCMNTTESQKCKSKEEIDKHLYDTAATLSFVFLNSYFDSKDYEQPIKIFLDDQFYWPIQSSLMKKTNIYVKQNTLNLTDSYFGGILPGEDKIYYQVSNSKDIVENPSFYGELANFYIRFDKEYDNYER